ncbi:MAG: response regulator [Gammaproteobacteria bacterium]|nr:response regulator [Gammaproteobacteria bacterium]
MQRNSSTIVNILLAEDNPADQELTRRVFEDSKVANQLFVVSDGVEAMEFLHNIGKYSDSKQFSTPDVILLDINMPKKDGKEVLAEIKNDPKLASIPVIMLTTSEHQKDIFESYKLGVNAYIAKPVDIEEFMRVVSSLENFWLKTAELPGLIKRSA